MWITHHKYLILLLNLLINCISAKGWHPYPICHAKHLVQPTHAPQKTSRVTKYIFCCKRSYKGKHRKKNNWKGLSNTPWWLYSTKTKNVTIKMTKSFTVFHTWHSKLLYWLLWWSCQNLFQEGVIDRHAQLVTVGNFEIIWNMDKILMRVRHCNICDRT